MKRDLELIRRILIRLEQGGAASGWSDFLEEGFELDAVQYHVQLLDDAGLIKADELIPGQWLAERMTWAGHEFLDAARNDERWQRATRQIEAQGGSAPFEVVRELLVRMAQESLGEDGTDGGAIRKPPRRRK